VSLNLALAGAGIVYRIKDGAEIARPVHIVNLHAARTEAGLASRNLVSVGKGAKVILMESYVALSSAAAQRNAVTELAIEAGARVNHVKYQAEARDSIHLSSWLTRIGKEAEYRAFQFSTGAALARNQIFVEFAGEGSLSHVSSAVLARGKQHNDTTIVIDHAVPHCESREMNKLVLDDEARGIVQCKVNVHRDAQKSDGHQMAHGLLLSEAAEFDSKPELEIFADDVVCGHGSTAGDIEEESLFYLRSRGIPEDEARALLIAAFAGEAIDKVEHEGLREAFAAMSESWLAAGMEKA
jgi:Fe-S cluster assembly protein SufD